MLPQLQYLGCWLGDRGYLLSQCPSGGNFSVCAIAATNIYIHSLQLVQGGLDVVVPACSAKLFLVPCTAQCRDGSFNGLKVDISPAFTYLVMAAGIALTRYPLEMKCN